MVRNARPRQSLRQPPAREGRLSDHGPSVRVRCDCSAVPCQGPEQHLPGRVCQRCRLTVGRTRAPRLLPHPLQDAGTSLWLHLCFWSQLDRSRRGLGCSAKAELVPETSITTAAHVPCSGLCGTGGWMAAGLAGGPPKEDTCSRRTLGQGGHLPKQDTCSRRTPAQGGHLPKQDTAAWEISTVVLHELPTSLLHAAS